MYETRARVKADLVQRVVVPAAGYIKSQSYVPWVQSRSVIILGYVFAMRMLTHISP